MAAAVGGAVPVRRGVATCAKDAAGARGRVRRPTVRRPSTPPYRQARRRPRRRAPATRPQHRSRSSRTDPPAGTLTSMDPLRLSAETHGFFTRTDAFSAGHDDNSIRRALKVHLWTRVRAGAYTYPELWPPDASPDTGSVVAPSRASWGSTWH